MSYIVVRQRQRSEQLIALSCKRNSFRELSEHRMKYPPCETLVSFIWIMLMLSLMVVDSNITIINSLILILCCYQFFEAVIEQRPSCAVFRILLYSFMPIVIFNSAVSHRDRCIMIIALYSMLNFLNRVTSKWNVTQVDYLKIALLNTCSLILCYYDLTIGLEMFALLQLDTALNYVLYLFEFEDCHWERQYSEYSTAVRFVSHVSAFIEHRENMKNVVDQIHATQSLRNPSLEVEDECLPVFSEDKNL